MQASVLELRHCAGLQADVLGGRARADQASGLEPCHYAGLQTDVLGGWEFDCGGTLSNAY